MLANIGKLPITCPPLPCPLQPDHFALILTNGVLGLYGSVFLFEGDGFGGVVELQVFQGVQYVLGLEGGFQFALQSQRFCRGRRLVY